MIIMPFNVHDGEILRMRESSTCDRAVPMKTDLLLSLLWSLVEVHSQPAAPYVSFMGENLPNHAYVNLTLVEISNSVRCNTDLTSCCRNMDGVAAGEWYFPNASAVRQSSDDDSIFGTLGDQRIVLRRRHDTMSGSGIYRCEVPTSTSNPMSETVYVGLYASGGD